jgi:hypothetical protein
MSAQQAFYYVFGSMAASLQSVDVSLKSIVVELGVMVVLQGIAVVMYLNTLRKKPVDKSQ